MPAYQIKSLPSPFKDQWNTFVNNHAFSTPLQLWEWGEVKRSMSWQPIHLGIFKQKKLIGVAQILQRTLPLGLSLFYCPRGPILDWHNPHISDVLTPLKEYFRSTHSSVKNLFLRLEPPIDKLPESESKKLKLHPYFKSIQPSHTSIIDLTKQQDKVLYAMDKDTRYSIRRAAREGIKVVKDEGKNLDYWKLFYDMYQKTSQKGFTPRSWRQFEKVFHFMASQNQATLYLSYLPPTIQRVDDKIPSVLTETLPTGAKVIAAAIILKTKQLGCYLWGASIITTATKNLFAPYILQWEIIQSLKNEGLSEYDLWGIAPTDNPQHAWSGHTLFKKGFAGKRVDYLGGLDLPLSPLYWIYKQTDYIRQKLLQPDLIEKK